MERFVNSVISNLETKNWVSALFLSVALPDICGALENPEMGVGRRYREWFDSYLRIKYSPRNEYETYLNTPKEMIDFGLLVHSDEELEEMKARPYDNLGTSFTADDCYRLRCKFLHQGLAEKMDGKKITFTYPDQGDSNIIITSHLCNINGTLQLSLKQFCLDICEGVKQWIEDNQSNAEIQERIGGLLNVYGLHDEHIGLVGYK